MKRAVTFFFVAVCAQLIACEETEPGTQVMVVIDAERSVRSSVRDVNVVVKSGDGDVSTWSTRFEMSLTQGTGEVAWPLEIALVPQGGDARRTYLVAATALSASGGAIAEVRAISGGMRSDANLPQQSAPRNRQARDPSPCRGTRPGAGLSASPT